MVKVKRVLGADPRWYEKLDTQGWFDEAWRDQWVFADPRLVRDRAGQTVLLAFHDVGHDGEFLGELSNPMPA